MASPNTFHLLKRTLALAIGGLALGAMAPALSAEAVVYTSNNVQTVDVALDIIKKRAPGLTVQKVSSGTGALMCFMTMPTVLSAS